MAASERSPAFKFGAIALVVVAAVSLTYVLVTRDGQGADVVSAGDTAPAAAAQPAADEARAPAPDDTDANAAKTPDGNATNDEQAEPPAVKAKKSRKFTG